MPGTLSNPPNLAPESHVAPPSRGEARLRENPRAFSFWQRFQIFFASWIGYLGVLLIGHSLRWQVYGWENWKAASERGQRLIYTVWHREIFSASWFWRKRGIVVMTSQNFDGDYIAKIIQRLGYGAARGSSTRGSSRALVDMIACLRKGQDAGFTIDGPRGPRYVAKLGSVLLSKATGAAILCFHVALSHAYVFRRSWDLTQFPYPFSPAAVFIAPPIVVSPKANDEELTAKLGEVQKTLDGLVERGKDWVEQTHARGRKPEAGK